MTLLSITDTDGTRQYFPKDKIIKLMERSGGNCSNLVVLDGGDPNNDITISDQEFESLLRQVKRISE
jgi:hypothetical protein